MTSGLRKTSFSKQDPGYGCIIPLMCAQADDLDPVIRYLSVRVGLGEITTSSAVVIGPILKQWLRHVDHAHPSTWTEAQVAEWVNDPKLKPSTRKSRLTKLRPFCRWLVEEGVLERDPTRRVGRIIIPDGNPRDLTFEEVQLVYATAPDDRGRLIVLLMAQMGLRCGDCARIRVEDIDVRRRSIHVRAKGGRGEPTHWEPVPAEAWVAVTGWVRSRNLRTGPLLRSYQDPEMGLTPAFIGKMMVGWMYACGVKLYPGDGRSAHSLRHSCAQHMLDNGADIRDVQFTLGHRTVRSTEKYTLREPPGLREAMEGRRYRGAA